MNCCKYRAWIRAESNLKYFSPFVLLSVLLQQHPNTLPFYSSCSLVRTSKDEEGSEECGGEGRHHLAHGQIDQRYTQRPKHRTYLQKKKGEGKCGWLRVECVVNVKMVE
jgi:hypothetical protein